MTYSHTLLLLFSILHGLGGALNAQSVISETRWASYLWRDLLVPEKEMTLARLTPYFRDLLRREKAPLINVGVCTNIGRMEAFWEVKLLYPAYQRWRMEFDRLNRIPLPMAQFVAIRGAGVLRVRSADGSVQTVLLGKPDSTGLLSDHGIARILSVSVGEWLYTPPRKETHVTLYIQTPEPLTEATGRRLLTQIGDLRFDETQVSVRNDSWFIQEPYFPAFYAFQPKIQPPSHEAYWNSPTMSCSQRPGEPGSCHVYTKSGNPPPGEPPQ